MNLFLIIAVSFVAGFVPAYLPLLIGRLLNENLLRWLTGLAAGILLAAALLIAIPEGFEIVAQNMEVSSEHHEEEHMAGDDVSSLQITNVMNWASPGVMVLAGFLVMMMIESLGVGHSIHEEHHDHEGDYGHAHVHHPRGLSGVVAVGLTVHALTDGVGIGAGMATGALDVAAPQLIGVVFHNFVYSFVCYCYSRSSIFELAWTWQYKRIMDRCSPFVLGRHILVCGYCRFSTEYS